jgi:apolipoprotein N-acyltransferase
MLQNIQNAARVKNEYIMTGFLLEENDNVYNASVLINPEGRLQSLYRKRTTVPFVETSTFTRGIRADTFLVDGHIIAPVICYESLFIRNYFRDRKPELYIVISNDIFAEKTVVSRQHQAYGVINARTLGIPLLQVMQNGPSFYVDSQGELANLTMPYEKVIGLPVKIR